MSFQTVTWGYLLPLTSARTLRVALLVSALFFAMVLVGRSTGLIPEEVLLALRHGVVVPGIPFGAALLSELAIREGITQRTLLYALVGPVSRRELIIGRTLLTSAQLALLGLLASFALHILSGASGEGLAREMGAIVVGSVAYTSLFGIIHLVSRRGLVSAIALHVMLDDPIGRLPFSIRMISPAFHLRTVAGLPDTFQLPISIDAAESGLLISTLALLVFTGAALAVSARLFERKPLGELC